MVELEKIEVRLPKHLVRWLRIYCERIAMRPDQFLAYVLEMYREFWLHGFELGVDVSKKYKELKEKTALAGIEDVIEMITDDVK